MSLRVSARPNKGLVVRFNPAEVRISPYKLSVLCSGSGLFLAAMVATLAIGFREPLLDYLYECLVLALAAGWCLAPWAKAPPLVPALSLGAILAWGLFQLGTGATVYPYATLEGSLRFAALAGTAWISYRAFELAKMRDVFLQVLAWFGAIVAIVSVLAYSTSPGMILWTFDAPYPDVWGPFLSRNNFAQFLELAMPAALWMALSKPAGRLLYLCLTAVMLASGLASASRAGSAILILEAIIVLWMARKSPWARAMGLGLVLATILFAAIPGVGNLRGRLTAPDPYQGRREIAQATLEMISNRPWTGFGLGTFPVVYPAYAVFDFGQSVDHAHNDWLEWTAEGGIAFAAVWIALALWSARRVVGAGWGIGVLGCFLHGVVDYPFARFGVSAWVFILIGMLAASEVREVRHGRH